jgi:vancomycin resistance protein YoaR
VVRAVVDRLCLLGALAAAGGAVVWLAFARWWPLMISPDSGATLPGLRIDGVTVDPAEGALTLARVRSSDLVGRRIRLVVHDDGVPRVVLDTTLGDLGVSVDVEAVAARAVRLGRVESMLERAKLADRARRGELDVPLEPAIDTVVTIERLATYKDDLDTLAVDARLDLDHHAVLPERVGRSLDLDGTAAAVARAAVERGAGDVDLPFVAVSARVTRASLSRIDLSRALASFATYFSRRGDQGPRARNIEAAASHLDGFVLDPGRVMSFNDVVGARIEENGFHKSFEIFKGEMVEGLGGGTCQVASTLHALAVYGGLEIVQRLPHSRPSAYIPAGLDATVVYPTVDLKIRNPFSFPVVINATASGNRLDMALLGADKPVSVTFDRDVVSTTPFARKVVEDPAIGKPKRKQKGIDGVEILRKRVITYRGGARRVESSHDTYPPTQEIWQVPPGYDSRGLPPLGEDFPEPDATRPLPGQAGTIEASVLPVD